MAKLTVKNVGPIREVELEVKKHTVFIGPQGSGKSTLAKLIAIGGDGEIVQGNDVNQDILNKYTIHNYVNNESNFIFTTSTHSVSFTNSKFQLSYQEEENQPVLGRETFISFLKETQKKLKERANIDLKDKTVFEQLLTKFLVDKIIISTTSIYIPAERTLLATLNEAIWSLIYSNIDFPKSIISFARSYENARISMTTLQVKFLGVYYSNRHGPDKISISDKIEIDLAQAASGYQSIIPLLLVIENQRRQSSHRFIIEEPELNLYPTAQKGLIYSLMSGLQPDVEYKDAEWVITTHSPYVLTSFNTLMLAYKVAQRSEELKEEVKKIVPERCWINPDEFSAYYVDNGTVESITSPESGLIDDSRLDDVSEDFTGEQDKLFALYRTALVND